MNKLFDVIVDLLIFFGLIGLMIGIYTILDLLFIR